MKWSHPLVGLFLSFLQWTECPVMLSNSFFQNKNFEIA